MSVTGVAPTGKREKRSVALLSQFSTACMWYPLTQDKKDKKDKIDRKRDKKERREREDPAAALRASARTLVRHLPGHIVGPDYSAGARRGPDAAAIRPR